MTFPKGYNPPSSEDNTPHNKANEKVVCRNCKKSNPSNSRFCNQCGVEIHLICSSCGNSNNVSDASFCNQCGSKLSMETGMSLQREPKGQKLVNQNQNINYRFQQYTLPEHNIKIKYPVEWEKIDKEELNPYVGHVPSGSQHKTLVMFRSPQENSRDTYQKVLAIGRTDTSINMPLETFVKLNLNDLEIGGDFQLIDNLKTTLAGRPAIQLTYLQEGNKRLLITTQLLNTFYYIMYSAEPTKYQKYLPTVRQMIDSFDFTVVTNQNGPASNTVHSSIRENTFLDYTSPEHKIKIKYPSSWVYYENVEAAVVAFQALKDSANDVSNNAVGISIKNLEANIPNLKEHIDSVIQDMRNMHATFVLNECYPTTLNGNPAYHLIYTQDGRKYLLILTVYRDKEYMLLYMSEPSMFMRHLASVEQMINSFEFL